MNARLESLVSRVNKAFGIGLAEREVEWLAEVFYPPESWTRWLASDSQLILGPGGSGRTTLAQQMLAYGNHPHRPMVFLWQPRLPRPEMTWEEAAKQILQLGVEALVHRLMAWDWAQGPPPSWVASLMRRLTQDVWEFPLDVFMWQHYPPGTHGHVEAVLEWIRGADASPTLTLSPVEAVQYIVILARALGYTGVWALFDLASEEVGDTLHLLQVISEVLRWFDVKNWSFKWFLPDYMARPLLSSAVVVRRRMEVGYLCWSQEEVRALVHRRLQWVSEGQWQTVRDVVKDPAFQTWLEGYGQTHPRAWLTLLHPFALERVRKGRPLHSTEWRAIAQRHPPPLFVELHQQRAYLGAKPLNLQPAAWRLLVYLYRHLGQVCSRRELYYRALEGADDVPRHDRFPWRSTLDSTLHRLREQLEGELRQSLALSTTASLYIQTQRGKGVALQHATKALGLRTIL